jgi:hypothetical protein
MKPKYMIVLVLSVLLIQGGCGRDHNMKTPEYSADVIIYGGTPAAVSAAIQVTRSGRTAIVVSPDSHLGGMSSSGLGYTDTGDKSVIGGLAREFYQRIYNYYQKPESWKWEKKEEYGNVGQGTPAIDGNLKTMWIFEPHIAERVFEDFVKEYKIRVFRNEWLDREKGVKKENGRIKSITTLNGITFSGKIFVDATYEGDMMAASGVRYVTGRESNEAYHETWNGIQTGVFHHRHNFDDRRISPYKIPNDTSSGLLWGVSPESPGRNGEGDHKLQAYCFRMCLTKNENNRIAFQRPEGYDSSEYELLNRVYKSGWRETFEKFDPIPNLKTDVNNHGPFSFDNIGMNYAYPEATYEQRKEIIRQHRLYQQGLLYFLATDPRVPPEVQKEMKQWGLAADEFADNGNWPYQIYVREARRMAGTFVMTENEIMGKNPVEQSIGMGSYTMDSHNVQRYITPEGYVQNEGDIGVQPEKPYKIALGCILPKREECSNLLVPVAVSSTHIAFGSIRMEPVFMILGQSAGIIAVLALEDGKSIYDIPYSELKRKLTENGQVLEGNNER